MSHFAPRNCVFLKWLLGIMNENLSVSVIIPLSWIDKVLLLWLATSLFPLWETECRNLKQTTFNLHAPIKTEHHYRASCYVKVKRNNGICAVRGDAPKWALANSTLHTARNVHPTHTLVFIFFPVVQNKKINFKVEWNLISHSEPAFWQHHASLMFCIFCQTKSRVSFERKGLEMFQILL